MKNNFKFSIFYFLVVILLGFYSLSEAATVYLKDGSQLRGTVVSATAQDLDLFTPHGTLHIKTDEIARIDYSDGEPPQPAAAQTPPPVATPAPTEQPSEETMRVPRRYRRRSPQWEEVSPESLPDMFSFQLGFASPMSRVSLESIGGGHPYNGETGIDLGLNYLHSTSDRLSLGLGFEFSNRGTNDTSDGFPDTDTRIYGDTMALLALAKYQLTDHGFIRPYVLLGIGPERTSTVVDTTPFGLWSDTGGNETRTLVDDAQWGVATTARLGLDFNAGAPAFFSLELGLNDYQNGSNSATRDGANNFGQSSVTGHLSTLSFLGKWGWRF